MKVWVPQLSKQPPCSQALAKGDSECTMKEEMINSSYVLETKGNSRDHSLSTDSSDRPQNLKKQYEIKLKWDTWEAKNWSETIKALFAPPLKNSLFFKNLFIITEANYL